MGTGGAARCLGVACLFAAILGASVARAAADVGVEGTSAGAPRDGPFATGGIAVIMARGGNVALRLDVGWAIRSVPGLRVLVATTLDRQSAFGATVSSIGPYATVQYALPLLDSRRGRFMLYGEGGAGPVFVWLSFPDRAFSPSHTDSEVSSGGRLAGGFDFTLPNGIFLIGQPMGAVFNFEAPSDTLFFEIGLRAGYRFQ